MMSSEHAQHSQPCCKCSTSEFLLQIPVLCCWDMETANLPMALECRKSSACKSTYPWLPQLCVAYVQLIPHIHQGPTNLQSESKAWIILKIETHLSDLTSQAYSEVLFFSPRPSKKPSSFFGNPSTSPADFDHCGMHVYFGWQLVVRRTCGGGLGGE